MADVNISVVTEPAADLKTPLLVLQQFERDEAPMGPIETIDQRMGGAIRRVLANGDFKGRKDETLVLYPSSSDLGAERIMLVGAGKREDFTLEEIRRAIGASVHRAQELGLPSMAVDLSHIEWLSEHMGGYIAAGGAAEAATLAAWRYRGLKSDDDEDDAARLESVHLVAGADSADGYRAGANRGATAARAQNLARELATSPGNIATPTRLAETAREIGNEFGLEVTVLDRAAIEAEGMGALMAVAQGSHEEPRFIVLEYRGADADEAPVALLGKGVTFDSGGISIKPSSKMEEMKYDMSGGAAVLAAMRGIAELGIEANVVGVVPATENLPSGGAIKPGDVVHSLSGKTIEIINTDAEGRLILADALTYAQRFNPSAMVDVATLTGSIVSAVGHHAIGLMGNSGDLMSEVRAAGQRTGDRCWPFPLWDEYRSQLDSQIADIKNTGGRAAGSITAGWFLKEFTNEIPWVHLDIAGTAWRDEIDPPLRKGATGVPTRLLIAWVRTRAEGP